MKQSQQQKNHWIFPENISFEAVANYSQLFEGISSEKIITFDLSETENIHSSFIGFLIHTKHVLTRQGGSLKLIVSFTAERILVMLNILDYFAPEITITPARKTA